MSAHSQSPHVSAQRQTHCREWLLHAAFSLSSQPDTDATVGDDNAANLQPSAHAGSTRHRTPCRVGYRATLDPRLRCLPGKDTATAHSHAKRTCGWASRAELTTHAVVPALVEACTTQHATDGRWGSRLLALNRRGVCDCRRCGDDNLRSRHHGRRQAGGSCLDVSVATCRPCRNLLHGISRHIAAWRTLQCLCSMSVSRVVQQAQCSTRGFGVA